MAITLTPEDRRIQVKNYIEKAKEALSEAEAIISIKKPTASVIMSHNAVFHMACALFSSDALEIQQGVQGHEALNHRFYEIYVDGEKIISDKTARVLGSLETDRNTALYHSFKKITLENAQEDLEAAKRFFSEISVLIPERLEYTIRKQENRLNAEEARIKEREDEAIEALKQTSFNLAKSHPKIYTKDSRYVPEKGSIVVNDFVKCFSLQQTASVCFVRHEHNDLDRIPEKGERVEIVYDKTTGLGKVKSLVHGRKPSIKQ